MDNDFANRTLWRTRKEADMMQSPNISVDKTGRLTIGEVIQGRHIRLMIFGGLWFDFTDQQMPNRWRRFWQRILLGWAWVEVE